MHRMYGAVFVSMLVVGCASQRQPNNPADISAADLEGKWLLALPAGYEHVATLTATNDQHLIITTATNLSGHFRINDSTLQIIDPADERKSTTRWTIVSVDKLVLTRSPYNMGSDYAGAVLSR